MLSGAEKKIKVPVIEIHQRRLNSLVEFIN